ncbi:hypothetical protein PUN28_014139 [Cardiocondyla obscurior]|uniref:Uncharacterized protein n=1 Tax=Cardiocondyla obscurior TaxID=286306 RepID=A0AAW2F3L3_9HYME
MNYVFLFNYKKKITQTYLKHVQISNIGTDIPCENVTLNSSILHETTIIPECIVQMQILQVSLHKKIQQNNAIGSSSGNGVAGLRRTYKHSELSSPGIRGLIPAIFKEITEIAGFRLLYVLPTYVHAPVPAPSPSPSPAPRASTRTR